VRPRRAAACRRVRCPRQLEDLDRVREPLHRNGPERLHLDVALDEPHRLAGQSHGPGGRELLHPGRQVGGLPHGCVVHAQIAADRAHNDLARVETDPDLHLHALRATKLIRVAPHHVLHPERGIARPDGVVLMGQRRAEERHDAVTHHLVNGSFVAVNGLNHLLENRVQNSACFLRVAVGEQLHRALEVGEEPGDLLALTFERSLGRQDLLGEVLRSIAVRGPRLRARFGGDRMRAGVAELGRS
jgi:hypothetical protein